MMASQIKDSRKELFSFYAIASLFSGGRLFVGAISVLYVLAHGISIADFAIIKSLQVVIFLFFDIPIGIFIKRYGYKNSLLAAFALSILGLLIYIVGSTLTHFLIAELLVALSLCLFPTAFTHYTMDFLEERPGLLMEKIFHRSDMYASLTTLLCGALGGYLFNIQKTLPYLAGIILQIIGYFLTKQTLPSLPLEMNSESQGTLNSFSKAWSSIAAFDSKLIIPIIILFIIQLTIQPLYHYWQPLFYELNENISGTVLGWVFASYSICSILLNFLFSKISSHSFFRSVNCIFFLLIVASIFYFSSAISDNISITFISFTLLQGILFSSLTCISAIINRLVDGSNRPITLKIISVLSRFGMLAFFGVIKIFSIEKIHNLYFFSALILFIAIIFIKSMDLFVFNKKLSSEVKFGNAIRS